MLKRLLKDRRGTNTVELTLIMGSLLLLTLGVIDVGRAALEWNAIQKSTQVGAREAITRDPIVLPIKYHFFCNPPADAALVGARCVDDFGNQQPECDFGTYTCTSTGCTGTNSAAYGDAELSQETFDAVVNAMRASVPGIAPENVTVSYNSTSLGFIGMSGGLPAEVSVSVTGVPFGFMALLPFGEIAFEIPRMMYTVTGEDFSNNSCEEQGLKASNPDANGVYVCQKAGNGQSVEAPVPVCFP